VAATVALAAQSHVDNDAVAIAAAKIPMAQAVATAEQYAKGRATHAEFESTQAGRIYGVEVVSGSKVLDVRVDADTGTVISVAEDQGDGDGGQDKDD
jgi:uncharacterized membrane protein YkoI